MNAMESQEKGGVQYINERMLSTLKTVQGIEIIQIRVKNNTFRSYMHNLVFLMFMKNIRECEYIFFDGFMPLIGRQKAICMVHDLMTVKKEVRKSLKRRIVMEIYFRVLRRKAHRIIAISMATADELVKRYKINRNRIAIIPPIIETPSLAKKSISNNYGKPLRLVFIGANRSNKNISTLIQAVEILLQIQVDITLTLIGPYSQDDILQLSLLCSNIPRYNAVRICSNISSEQKYSILRRSHFLVLPSFQEGFGMPCIEAFSVGLPVICSDIPVFREITKSYAEFFNPNSSQELVKTILKARTKSFDPERMRSISECCSVRLVREKLESLLED